VDPLRGLLECSTSLLAPWVVALGIDADVATVPVAGVSGNILYIMFGFKEMVVYPQPAAHSAA